MPELKIETQNCFLLYTATKLRHVKKEDLNGKLIQEAFYLVGQEHHS